jgi:16S rRNA processing protein RimM
VADVFAIGRVVKSHGLKGAMKVVSYVESKELLQGLKEVFLGKEGREGIHFKVRRIEIKGKTFFLEVENVDDAEEAGRWVDSEVLASSSILEQLPEGEYYWRDLIGLRVVTEEGRYLGRIERIFPTGSNDVYVCRGEREILLPALEEVIRDVDAKKGVMVVRLFEGLEDG